ncbi:MAG: hypothetical protein LBV19_02050 [Streptococcaceae bacterium]|jgi:hypothetical protein|nr:hypothetical protein [Streptococcaceae bacterium]
MIKVIGINWADDGQQEADITLSDGRFSITCFFSTSMSEQAIFTDKIYSLDARNIVRTEEKEALVQKLEGFYAYFLRGKLKEKAVIIGELKIELSTADIPKDIQDGEMVELTVSRLDIY